MFAGECLNSLSLRRWCCDIGGFTARSQRQINAGMEVGNIFVSCGLLRLLIASSHGLDILSCS
jgi:hypothetical protein